MKVLLTGATGFLGGHMTEALLNEGYQVAAMIRKSSDTSLLEDLGVELREGYLDRPESLLEAVRGVDAVIHLAAYYTFSGKWEMYKKVNIDGTEALLRASMAEGVPQFIYCSSTEAMGPVDSIPADEYSPLNPSFDYGRSKMLAEEVVRRYAANGISSTILRPSGIYGPRNVNDVSYWFITSFANSIASRFMIGNGSSHVQFVHVDDVVQAHLLVLKKPDVSSGETYIVSEERSYSYEDVYRMLAEIMGKKMPRIKLPPLLAKVMIAPVQAANDFLRRDNFMWRISTVDAVTSDRSYSVEKIKEDLGYSPRHKLKDGLRETVEWYRDNGHIRN